MRHAARRATSGLLAIMIAGSPLCAQESHLADVGLAVVRFPEDDRWIAGPWLRVAAQRDAVSVRSRLGVNLIASGTGLSASADGAVSRHGVLDAGPLEWEAGAEGDAMSGGVSGTQGSLLGLGRLLYPIGAGGVWVRGTGHLAHRESGALTGRSLDAGGWWRASHTIFTAELSGQRAEGQLFAGKVALGAVPVRYVQALLGARSAGDWGSLEMSAGARRDPDATQRVEPVWSVSTLLRASQRVGVVLNVARQPDDFIRGADAMQSVSIGLRFASHASAGTARQRTGPVVELLADEAGGPRRLRVRATGANTVELMGDFTEWETVHLTPAGGDFILDVPLSAGAHRLLLRVDGGAWIVPANTPAVDDDFGGRVGLMVVP